MAPPPRPSLLLLLPLSLLGLSQAFRIPTDRIKVPLFSSSGTTTTSSAASPSAASTTTTSLSAATTTTTAEQDRSLAGTTGTWNREAWIKGFETARTEECYEIVDPSIPKDLEGTLFRNGHAKFDVAGTEIAHPFDGDGMITALTFKDGRAFFRNRFVETTGYKKELQSKKIEYRGTFGTQKEGGWLANIFDLRRKNVANTNVVYWGKKLLALWEGGLPHNMEPMTLQTFGESRVGKVLKPSQNLGAHPRYDPITDRYIFFSTDPDPRQTKITCYEFDRSFKLVAKRTESVPGFSLMHDMVVTPNYYIFFKAPLSLNPLSWILGTTGVAACINFEDNKPAIAYLIPRTNPQKPLVGIEVDPHFSFHFSNAFEEPSTGKVMVDIIRVPKLYLTDTKGRTGNPIWKTVNYEQEVPKSTLWRYTLDPATNTHTRTELYNEYCDFPSVPPSKQGQPYTYTYLAAGRDKTLPTPVGAIVKFNTQTATVADSWMAEPHEFISEAVVVPKPKNKDKKDTEVEEDDVYLMTYVFNGLTSTSQVLIFDAKSLSKGPLSRLQLTSNIPLSLHGNWAPDAVWEGDDILRKFTLYTGLKKFDAIESGMAPIIDF